MRIMSTNEWRLVILKTLDEREIQNISFEKAIAKIEFYIFSCYEIVEDN